MRKVKASVLVDFDNIDPARGLVRAIKALRKEGVRLREKKTHSLDRSITLQMKIIDLLRDEGFDEVAF